MAEQPADGLQGLNDVDAFARILATKFQKPQPDLQGREVHMPEDQENRIMRQVHASVIQNPEGMSRAIVDAVRRGNSSEYAHEMALQHAKDPFYTDDIVIFKGDGLTVLTESIPPADELQDQENEAMMDNSFNEDGTVPPESIQPAAVAGGRIPTQNEGSAGVGARIPTREDQEAEVTMESEWPDPQGLDALPKIAVDPPGYFRVYVVYAGEQVGISSQLMVFKVGGGTPFGELMASYEDAIQLSCDAKLEYYHGPSQITEEDTLDVLADDEIIILDQDNDFVLHTYDVDDLLDDKNSNDNNAVGEEEINEDPDGGKHNQRDDEENVAERHNFEEEDEDEEEDEGKDKEKGDDKVSISH